MPQVLLENKCRKKTEGSKVMYGKQPIKQRQTNLLECGPMPNVMVALLNIGGALCSTLQSLPDAHYQNAMQ